jgi:hypothetical protein
MALPPEPGSTAPADSSSCCGRGALSRQLHLGAGELEKTPTKLNSFRGDATVACCATPLSSCRGGRRHAPELNLAPFPMEGAPDLGGEAELHGYAAKASTYAPFVRLSPAVWPFERHPYVHPPAMAPYPATNLGASAGGWRLHQYAEPSVPATPVEARPGSWTPSWLTQPKRGKSSPTRWSTPASGVSRSSAVD